MSFTGLRKLTMGERLIDFLTYGGLRPLRVPVGALVGAYLAHKGWSAAA